MERAEAAEGATGLQWRKTARKEHRRERQRRGEVDEGGEERRIRSQISQEVVAGIEEKVSVHDGVEAVQNHQDKVSREAGIAHKLKMKKEESWREGDEMAAQGDEEQKLEEIVERMWRSYKRYWSQMCRNACHKAKKG